MQRLLLDTHAFIWWLSDVPQLSRLAHDGIADPRNEVLVSAITGWEIAVKRAKGRITAPDNLGTMVTERASRICP